MASMKKSGLCHMDHRQLLRFLCQAHRDDASQSALAESLLNNPGQGCMYQLAPRACRPAAVGLEDVAKQPATTGPKLRHVRDDLPERHPQTPDLATLPNRRACGATTACDARTVGVRRTRLARLSPRVPRPAPPQRRGGSLSVLHAAKDRELPGSGPHDPPALLLVRETAAFEGLHLWSRGPDKKVHVLARWRASPHDGPGKGPPRPSGDRRSLLSKRGDGNPSPPIGSHRRMSLGAGPHSVASRPGGRAISLNRYWRRTRLRAGACWWVERRGASFRSPLARQLGPWKAVAMGLRGEGAAGTSTG